MQTQTDFMVAVNQIAAERGLDVEEILEAVKHAIRTGFKKDYGYESELDENEEESNDINVEIDPKDGSITVYVDKKVVEKVTDPRSQISIKEARSLESKLELGDHVEIDVTPEGDFGRVAAQTAKQVILQKLRETEKESQIKKFVDRVGEIETGIVQRMDGDSVLWEIGRATAIMPNVDRIQNEYYKRGAKHKVLLKEIKQTPRGKNIIVSRSDPKFLEAIFKLEIPELLSETIEIKSIAREAGQRSKVAVASNVDGVDPIGSCVGQRGVRIMAIMNELKMGMSEEKIDIILWDADEEQFVINALSPAQVVRSKILNKEDKIIRLVVPDDQLSLAIGKDGQNVRLAAKLTGWNIDIQGETVVVDSEVIKAEEEEKKEAGEKSGDAKKEKKVKKEKKEKKETKVTKEKKTKTTKKVNKEKSAGELSKLELSPRTLKALESAGVTSLKDLKKIIKDGEKIKGVGPKAVEEIEASLK